MGRCSADEAGRLPRWPEPLGVRPGQRACGTACRGRAAAGYHRSRRHLALGGQYARGVCERGKEAAHRRGAGGDGGARGRGGIRLACRRSRASSRAETARQPAPLRHARALLASRLALGSRRDSGLRRGSYQLRRDAGLHHDAGAAPASHKRRSSSAWKNASHTPRRVA